MHEAWSSAAVICDNKDCQVQLCPSCAPVKHNGHRIIDLEDKADSSRSEISNTRDGVREIISSLETHLEDLKKMGEKIKDDVDENRKLVEETKQGLLQLLNELQQRVVKEAQAQLEELAKNEEGMLNEVKRAIEETESSKSKFDGLHEEMGQKMANLSNNEIVSQQNTAENDFLQMKVQELANRSYDVKVNALKYTKPKTGPKPNFEDFGKLSLFVNSPAKIVQAKPKSVLPTATYLKSINTDFEADRKITMAVTQKGDLVVCGKVADYNFLKCQKITDGIIQWGKNMGQAEKSTVKGLCCVKGAREYLVVTVDRRIELRDIVKGELISEQTVDFDPGKVCAIDQQQSTFFVSTDQGKILNFSINEEKQRIQLNKKVIQTGLNDVESLAAVAHQGKLLVVVAAWFPESVIEAVQYDSGAVVWKLTERDTFEGQPIRPHGLASDNQGNVFVGDTTNERVLLLTADGKIRQKLIKMPPNITKCISWDSMHRRLLVNWQSEKEMVGVYEIRYGLA